MNHRYFENAKVVGMDVAQRYVRRYEGVIEPMQVDVDVFEHYLYTATGEILARVEPRNDYESKADREYESSQNSDIYEHIPY